MEEIIPAEADRAPEEQTIKPKMQFNGTVVKTTLAGAVIDIGTEKPAMLHVSQISATGDEEAIKSVKDILQVGQQVEVWIKKVKDERIELTMIKPLDLEWREIKKGMNVKGKVVRLEKFGAFVEIGAERPGLIHISEMAHGYVRTPNDVVNEGDEVEAEIIDVNRKKKQIKLSMKALQPEPVKEEEPVRPTSEVLPKKDKVPRKKKQRKERRTDGAGEYGGDLVLEFNDHSEEAEPTAMEIAIRKAMEKAKAKKQEDKSKKSKVVSTEQEDIIARTLDQKSTNS